jgi:hypothetical protein
MPNRSAAILWLPSHAVAQKYDRAEQAQLTNPWFMRSACWTRSTNPRATIATSGQTIPGATATVSDNVTLMFDLGYDITKAFSIQIMGGIPPKPTVTAERTVAVTWRSRGGSLRPRLFHRDLPHTRLARVATLRRSGAVYAIILDDHGTMPCQISSSSITLASPCRAAFERSIANTLELFVDFKEAWLAVDAHGKRPAGPGDGEGHPRSVDRRRWREVSISLSTWLT